MALKTSKIAVPPYAPYNPPKMSSAIVYAAKAVFAGEALKDQQRLFIEWLTIEVCRTRDLPWFPGGLEGDRDTCLANGKRFVGLSVLRAIDMPAAEVAAMRDAELKARGLPTTTEGESIERE